MRNGEDVGSSEVGFVCMMASLAQLCVASLCATDHTVELLGVVRLSVADDNVLTFGVEHERSTSREYPAQAHTTYR